MIRFPFLILIHNLHLLTLGQDNIKKNRITVILQLTFLHQSIEKRNICEEEKISEELLAYSLINVERHHQLTRLREYLRNLRHVQRVTDVIRKRVRFQYGRKAAIKSLQSTQ